MPQAEPHALGDLVEAIRESDLNDEVADFSMTSEGLMVEFL